jgi:uncharacterized protein
MDSRIDPTTPRTVTVTGAGRVTVPPDVAELHLGVAVTRPTASAAQADAAATMAAVIAAIREVGVADADLRTLGLSLQPVMDYRGDEPPRLLGYELRNGVVARLRDLGRLPAAIDGAIAAGATSLDGVSFDVEDRAVAEAAARAAAVSHALDKAGALARAAGATLGDVMAINEGSPPAAPIPLPKATRLMAADSAMTVVQAGTSEIVVQVELVVGLA